MVKTKEKNIENEIENKEILLNIYKEINKKDEGNIFEKILEKAKKEELEEKEKREKENLIFMNKEVKLTEKNKIFIEKVKNIVLEKGFCILEIKNFRNVEFLIDLKKELESEKYKYATIILGIFGINIFLTVLISDLKLENTNLGKIIIGIVLFLYIFVFLNLFFLKQITFFRTLSSNKKLENLKGIKNKFIIVFEDNVFIDKKNFSINSGDLMTNNGVLRFLFEKDKNYEKIIEILKIEQLKNHFNVKYNNDLNSIHIKKIQEVERTFTENFLIKSYYSRNEKFINLVDKYNKQEKFFSKFYKNSFLLENETKNLVEIKNILEKNISENKDFFAKSLQIQEGFEKFSKKTGEILKKKDEILDFLKKFFPKEKVSFEKYIFWLKKQIISPLNSMKDILQKNLDYCNFLLEKNKNNENEQIELSNKRLEIQKNNLQKQISVLDEKIKILEK